MLKKLFKFGKKNQQEVQSDEVVKEQEVINTEDNSQIEKENENVEIEENKELVDEQVIEEISDDDSVHNEVVEDNTIEDLNINESKVDEDIQEEISTEIEEVVENEVVNQELDIDSQDEKDLNENNEANIELDEEISAEEVIESDKDEEEPKKKVNLFERLKQGLTKAKQGITEIIEDVLKSYTKVDEELLEELEEILITADVGVNTTMDIIDKLRDKIKDNKITEPQGVKEELKNIIEEILTNENSNLNVEKSPTIILMVGVNGVGKTTTIGKLANRYKQEGKKVLLAAGDTFRAAAIEQLEVWAGRSNVDIIKHQEGADPGAVVFDAIKAAKAR